MMIYFNISTISYLSPVGEDLAIAAVRDEFMRKLRNSRVKVVHDHVHDGCCLATLGRVLIQWVGSKHTELIRRYIEKIVVLERDANLRGTCGRKRCM